MVSMKMSVLMAAVVMIVLTTKVAEGQQSLPPCVSGLLPCANFLNTTGPPPASCCNPLRDAVNNQFGCLCNIFQNPGLLANFNINMTQVLEIPGRCGIPVDIRTCRAGSPGPAPFSPTRPGQVPGGNNSNGVGKIASTGFLSLVLLWASLMLY